YADHFDLKRRLRLNTQVEELRRRDDGGFLLTTRREGDAPEEHAVDFVVMVTGVYRDPFIPELSWRDAFELAGRLILHSTECHDTELVDGKRVVVVGYGKSATDVANAAIGYATGVSLVYRSARWKAPRFLFGALNMKYAVLIRGAEILFPNAEMDGFSNS